MIEENSSNGKVIYDRQKSISRKKQPKFKPGKTPHTKFGDDVLNFNIPWNIIVQEILVHYTQEQLLDETGITPAHLSKILEQKYRELTFKMGATLLAIHSRFHPERYH